MEEFFSPNSSEDQKTAPNIIQCSDADQSQIIGGNIFPYPPGFRHPCIPQLAV